MDSVDLHVLRTALAWKQGGHQVALVTVIKTWGSSPRPPGALLALKGDGQVVGSVSGGCIEDDLIERVRTAARPSDKPELLVYGVTKAEAARLGLPCGGTIQLVQEAVADAQWVADLIERTANHEMVARLLDMQTGAVTLVPCTRTDTLTFDGNLLRTIHGPRWRLLIIGAGQLSHYLAQMAQTLDFQVIVCEPRDEYAAGWDVPGAVLTHEMPDDVVLALQMDSHTAVVAVTHDPKLDDMALLEALKSKAFYIGALGSRVNTAKRKERLALFDLSREEIARLHGPIGLRIGSRTPPEIAISILAEITAVKNAGFVSSNVTDLLQHGMDLPVEAYATT